MKRGEILREEREKHLEQLKQLGVDPYPAAVQRDHTITEALKRHGQPTAVAGRVIAIRSHGKAIFCDLADETGKIQVYAKADELGDRFDELELLDEGDFLAVQGEVFTTKLGEITVHIQTFQILVKTLRPLPSQWQGLKDVEERYRKRYLDLLLNPEVRHIFDIRTKTIAALRIFLTSQGFIEVDTPVLQPLYGGASARPFTTYYNAYDTNVYLRVAPELYLKRLIVGGYEKVFEFARNFRNEGADTTHNPEYTGLEFYAAYWDEQRLMDFTEELMTVVIEEVLGKPAVTVDGQTIAIKQPFARRTFAEVTGGAMTDEAFKQAIKNIQAPTFITQSPRTLIPLAKRADDQTGRTIQFVLGGIELIKAYSELNDPLDQRGMFEEQMGKRAKGDEEAQVLDEDFLEALEYGLPPTGGWGLGVDRFIALLAGQDSLRQTMFFPFMKPRQIEIRKQKKEIRKDD